MSSANPGGRKHGTLILMSSQLESLAGCESIALQWNVVSVLLGSHQPSDLIARLARAGDTVIVALDATATDFVLTLDPGVFGNVAGLCLVGEAAAQLGNARLLRYHGNVVFLAKSPPVAHTLTMLRRRFTGLRCSVADGPDGLKREISMLLDRVRAVRSHATTAPLVSWR